MLVPFIYATNDFVLEIPAHIWIFHKYANFAYKNKFPIIASDIYFKHYENPLNDTIQDNFMFTEAPTSYLEKMQKYSIKNDGISKIINKDNTLELTTESFIKTDKILEQELYQILELIKKDYPNQEITLLTWLDNATLRKVAKKMNIKIIFQELSGIRKDQYNSTLCYCSFNPKYNDNQREKYNEFLKVKDKLMVLSKEEILSLFLREDQLGCLKEMQKPPKYKVGVTLGLKTDWFFKLCFKEEQSETLDKIKKMYSESEISYRFHPSQEMDLDFGKCHRDTNKYSHNWILENDAIVSSVSNVGFEAMLFGKRAFVITDAMPWSFQACNDVKYLKFSEEGITSDSFISYMIFGYFVPLELAFDKNYLEWRLSNPSIKDIYNKNLEFILKKRNLNLSKGGGVEFLYEILTKYRNLPSKDALEIINYNYYNELNSIINDKTKKIEDLNKIIHEKETYIDNLELELHKIINEKDNNLNNLASELNNIINSKSWKITSPLRSFSKTIKRIGGGKK